MTTIQEQFGENCIGFKIVRLNNKMGFYLYKKLDNGIIIRQTIEEISSKEQSLKDICKELDIDWHEADALKGLKFGKRR